MVLRAMLLAALAAASVGLAPGVMVAFASQGGSAVSALYGEPKVMEFKDGKAGAFSMVFDDSMLSQADTAIPLLNARGLVGTFFVNPGTERYQQRRETWEVICPKSGHELANHTWRHEGAKDLEQAEFEIGESSRHIWKLYPQRSQLLLFARGGGTTWGPTREQIQEVTDRYLLARRPRSTAISDEGGTAAQITSFPQRALEEKTWVAVHFHGVGGEWISTNAQAFVNLLDFLVAHRDQLWVAPETAGYKYQQEYQALSRVALNDASEAGFTVVVECDPSKVSMFGRPFPQLYDEPLTVRVSVPDSWSRFQVKQGAAARGYETIQLGGRRCAQFDVLPNVGSAAVVVVNPGP